MSDKDIQVAVEKAVDMVLNRRPQVVEPQFKGYLHREEHPIDRKTVEAAQAIQNTTALVYQAFGVQVGFVNAFTEYIENAPPEQRQYLVPIAKQMWKIHNAKVMDQVESAADGMRKFTESDPITTPAPEPKGFLGKAKKWWDEN